MEAAERAGREAAKLELRAAQASGSTAVYLREQAALYRAEEARQYENI